MGINSSSGPGATSGAVGSTAGAGAAGAGAAGAACWRGRSFEVAQDVVAGDASAEAGALNPAQVNGVLAGQAAHGGREALPAVGGRGRCGGRRGLCWGGGRCDSCWGSGSGGWSACRLGYGFDSHHRLHGFDGCASGGADGGYALHQVAGGGSRRSGRGLCRGSRRFGGWRGARRRRGSGRGFARIADLCDGCAHGQSFAFLGEDLEEFPGHRRGDFHGDLVGHNLDERLVATDGLARLLEPLADGAFNYGFADVG